MSDLGIPFTNTTEVMDSVKNGVLAVDLVIAIVSLVISFIIFFLTCCCWLPCLAVKKKFVPLQYKTSRVDRFFDFFLFAMKWFFADSKDYFFPLKALPYLQFLGVLPYMDARRKNILKNRADEADRLESEELDSESEESETDEKHGNQAKAGLAKKETRFPWFMKPFRDIEFGPMLAPIHKGLTVLLFFYRIAVLIYAFYWDYRELSTSTTSSEFFQYYMKMTYISFDIIIIYMILVTVYSAGYILNKVTVFASKMIGEPKTAYLVPARSYAAQFCGFIVQIVGEIAYVTSCLVTAIYWIFLVDYSRLSEWTEAYSIARHTTSILMIFDFLLSDFRFHWSHFSFVCAFIYSYLSLLTLFQIGGVLKRYPYKILSYYESSTAVFYHAIALPILLVFFLFFWVISVVKTLFFHSKRPLVMWTDAKVMGSSPQEYEDILKQSQAEALSDEEEDEVKAKEGEEKKKKQDEEKKKTEEEI